MRQPVNDTSTDVADADVVRRPTFDSSVNERFREWVAWFGVARLVTSAAATLVVCAGAWFLLRTPPPPSEAGLPFATAPATSIAPAASPIASAASIATTEAPPSPTDVVVHVAGAVAVPGVYELDGGSRVGTAIERAGGATVDADLGALNLAAPVVDGTQIYLPEQGETPRPATPPTVPPTGVAAAPAAPVDVNRASVDELDSLPGIGPATAQAIVTDRDRNGPFLSVAELERVPGIGPAKLAALEGLVVA